MGGREVGSGSWPSDSLGQTQGYLGATSWSGLFFAGLRPVLHAPSVVTGCGQPEVIPQGAESWRPPTARVKDFTKEDPAAQPAVHQPPGSSPALVSLNA